MWDTGEYMAAAKVLGLPHPPGNPLFILIANAFAKLPLPGSYAQHVNTLAAAASAASAGIWFLVTERIVSSWLEERWQRITVASVATLIGGTAFTVWNRVVTRGLYCLVLFFALSLVDTHGIDDKRGTCKSELLAASILIGTDTQSTGGTALLYRPSDFGACDVWRVCSIAAVGRGVELLALGP